MNKIRILIVDDHPMMREALLNAIEDEPDLEAVGEATNGFEALTLTQELKPDIILMDLLMPGMDGLEAINRIYQADPEVKILTLTSLEDDEKVYTAIQSGALGYIPKTASRVHLLQAIRKVAGGDPYLPSSIALKLFRGLRRVKPISMPQDGYTEPITIRQGEILALLGEGKTDEEIAATLHLQENTVRSHISHIIQRLGLENRSQAVAYANQIRR